MSALDKRNFLEVTDIIDISSNLLNWKLALLFPWGMFTSVINYDCSALFIFTPEVDIDWMEVVFAYPDIHYPDIRIYPLILWQPKIRIS